MDPKISIITIVKNDRGIADTLAGLSTQERPAPTEIIVVDASKPEKFADIRAKYPEVIWHQFTPRTVGKTSIPEQRNVGIELAKGEIVVFIDANCKPSERWLVEITRPILEGKETMVAGSVRASDERAYVNTNPEDAIGGDYLTSSGTGNLAFKKELWNTVGKFDESYLFGSDVDFTWRCVLAGNKIRFLRDVYITHNFGSLGDEIARSFRYGKARAVILKKHPELFKELLGGSPYLTVYTIYFLGLPLTLFYPWYPFTLVLAVIKNIGSKHPFKRVFLNMIYTVGMWFEFAVMAASTMSLNATESSPKKR